MGGGVNGAVHGSRVGTRGCWSTVGDVPRGSKRRGTTTKRRNGKKGRKSTKQDHNPRLGSRGRRGYRSGAAAAPEDEGAGPGDCDDGGAEGLDGAGHALGVDDAFQVGVDEACAQALLA